MGVISVAVEHAIRLGAGAEQILSLVQAMEAELPSTSLIRVTESKKESKKISQEDQLVSQEIDTKESLDCSLVQESISTSALVQESICEIRQKPRKTRKRITDTPDFTLFWRLCPRPIAKGHARKAWAKAIQIATPDEIRAGMERFANLCRKNATEEQYICHPSTWLNQERWLDEGTSKPQNKPLGPKRTWAEIKAEREKNGDSLVRRDDESPERTASSKKPPMARISDLLPPFPPMDYTQENETTLLAEAIPDEVFIRRDERESETFILSN